MDSGSIGTVHFLPSFSLNVTTIALKKIGSCVKGGGRDLSVESDPNIITIAVYSNVMFHING